jgi:uncharacterized protein (TIGR00730 family)
MNTAMSRQIRRVYVYCASSRKIDHTYLEAASHLGRMLAQQGITLVYGGGSVGAMGALADGALVAGGRVIGVLPRFMYDLEWGHRGLTELRLVNDLHERKRLMIEEVDAIVALPGGSGTLEELLEAITWKRLGLYVYPIVLVNIRRFFDPLVALFDRAVAENFMDARHRLMWTVVEWIGDVMAAIREAAAWSAEARKFATV